MCTSPVSPEDVRAAAEVHAELGPEYSDAVVAAFIAKVDRQVDARVQARLTSAVSPARPAEHEGRWALLKGLGIGMCAGAITVAGIGLAVSGGSAASMSHGVQVVPSHGGPMRAQLLPYLGPRARTLSPLHPSRQPGR
jgi:hypothetical protein